VDITALLVSAFALLFGGSALWRYISEQWPFAKTGPAKARLVLIGLGGVVLVLLWALWGVATVFGCREEPGLVC